MTTRTTDVLDQHPGPDEAPQRSRGPELLCALLLGAVALQPALSDLLDVPALQTWSTVFVSITVQALPFLVLGVLVSASIAAFLPASVLQRALPSRPALAVPVAGAAGVLLPGCECGSVPVASSLMSRGIAPAAALTFLLSAPAINPIVLVATAVAFPGRPEFVGARLVASLATAIVVGLLWVRFGQERWLRRPVRHAAPGESRRAVFTSTVRHDFLHAGGFLVLGGLTAATLNVLVPRDLYRAVAEDPVLSVLALAVLAVVLAICSEADAFVAASLTEFSSTAKLTFMVVGPMVDVKLVALQAGTFGRGFAARFAPVTLVVAVVSSVVVGQWFL